MNAKRENMALTILCSHSKLKYIRNVMAESHILNNNNTQNKGK